MHYFSINCRVTSDDYKLYLTDVITERFTFSQVSCLDVENIVRSFKDSSPGADEIPMILFKENLSVLVSTVIFICNLSLMTGIFPSELATAIITCILKSGNIYSFENYMSISILNAFSKILEKIITVQLVQYFVVSNFFAECQFGYRQGVSKIDAVLRIVNFIYDSFDERKIIIGVFLNLTKAFDMLNRSILFHKLETG